MTGSTQVRAEITMPRLSDSMEEATVLAWLKQPGEAVASGEPLVEIETDKATMVYEAERDGVLGGILVGAGEVAALGAPIGWFAGDASEPEGSDVERQAPAPEAGPAIAAPPRPEQPPPARPDKRRARATPLARRVAADQGVDLFGLSGTGPGGRIVRADVMAALAAGRSPEPVSSALPRAAAAGDERLPLSATQRTIARRMSSSRSEVPEFTLTAEIDMTAALAARRELNELLPSARISLNDLVVKAAALVLREQPEMNAAWDGEAIVRRARVNVGVAVATEGALLVPVIFDADRKPLPRLAAETRAAGERARTRSSSAEELSGATFTVSNLGMFGVLSFDAVIDAPQAAILAVGTVVRRPVFDAADAVVARELMQVSLACDHRVVYGAEGARFLARLRELLEHPMLLTLPAHEAAGEEVLR
jgi:pyruvate dehydrogenase E2 component (dihydrolipoyllysine-residue acetyltransferase)